MIPFSNRLMYVLRFPLQESAAVGIAAAYLVFSVVGMSVMGGFKPGSAAAVVDDETSVAVVRTTAGDVDDDGVNSNGRNSKRSREWPPGSLASTDNTQG